ncbi:POK18 protein, partial [Oreotrochilus melanogaster]|nr:POK18 protein [Oreotrochilus melanogaster]
VQKLVGLIGWIRSYLGITNHQMQPLFDLLSGITSSTDEKQLTSAAKKTLEEVELALAHKFVNRIDPSVGVQLFILKDHEIPCGILCQWNDNWEDQLHIL